MASHHVARLCNVGSSPSLSWLLFERRGGGGRCQKQRARARPRAYTCTETEQKGCTCNGIHDRVCRLFHRPGRMQDVTCLTISSHSTNPPLPSRSSSSLLSLCLSSRPFGSWPTRPRDCLPLAYRLMQLYVLRQFAPICRCVLSLSLSLSACFPVPIRHWLLSLPAFPGQQLETERSNPRDFARGCFLERISRRVWVGKLLEVCGVRMEG